MKKFCCSLWDSNPGPLGYGFETQPGTKKNFMSEFFLNFSWRKLPESLFCKGTCMGINQYIFLKGNTFIVNRVRSEKN